MGRYLIIGAGRVGRALHLCLDDSTLVASRTLNADIANMIDSKTIVLLACRDGAIDEHVAWLKAAGRKMRAVVHFAGSISHQTLAPLLEVSEGIARAHPCRIISARATSRVFYGGVLHVTGNEVGLLTIDDLGRSLGMFSAHDSVVSFDLYHCALYFIVAEHTVSSTAMRIALAAGLSEARLHELANSIFSSEFRAELPTTVGPVARGDTATIQRHLAALRSFAPECVEVYKKLFHIPVHL